MPPWDTRGNDRTNPANDFLGTTDNQPLAIRTNGTEALRVGTTGNVGIGTTEPNHVFHVRTGDAVGLFESTGTQAFLRLTTREGIDNRVEITNRPGGRLSLFTSGAGDVLNITRGGNVGIGTVTPAARLSVNGDVEVTGDIRLLNADCAEDFDVAGAEETQPGTVMIIDEGGALKRSHQAYDNRVAGVVSGAGDLKPGIILDKGESNGGRLPIALMGKVACKVDARHSPIGVGDLLTTSSTPGYAMKAANPFKAFGAVLGKALCPLKEGQGLIPVLVALQ